uniref:RBR-type E3 ubiquitin transferase n=1 Tax=Arcella intermedia TaxID=1963864 RepID=A0A6B2L2M4_9EUKA
MEDGDYGEEGYGEEEEDYLDGTYGEDVDPFGGTEDHEHEAPEYTVIPASKIEVEINKQIKEAQDLLNLDEEYAALVLQYFKWNMEAVTEKFYDDPDKCVKEAGAVLTPPPQETFSPEQKVPCLVCLEDVPIKSTYSLPCGHKYYCLDCWRTYLKMEFELRAMVMATNTTCISPNCPVRIGKYGYKKLASEEINEKFRYFFTKSYIDTNKQYTFCPNSKCGNAIRYSGYGKPTEVVECSCGNRFCFACGKENHSPVLCEQLDMWILKNESEDESLKLVKLLSKPCFHCRRMTERIDGCNHMNCRKDQGGCGNHWCWMCGGDWATHGSQTGGYFSCNKYEQSDRFKIDKENDVVREEIKRFQFHFQRFFEHGVKEKDAENAKVKVQSRQQEFRSLTANNPDFLMEAQKLLIEVRHALKYTYVFGYFLPQNDPFRPLFEDQQTRLEAVTESLADMAFAPLTELNPQAIKNQTRVVKNFMKAIVEELEKYATEQIAKTKK